MTRNEVRRATGAPPRSPERRYAAGAVLLICVAANVRVDAAVVPVFVESTGVSMAAADHRPDVNQPAGRQGAIAYNNGSATNKAPYNPSALTFPNGSTVAKAGIGRSQSTNRTQVTFASGTGVSQDDPTHTQAASVLVMTFRAQWSIAGGSFGPPLTSSFSVPVGVRVNSKGSASFFCDVHWGATVDGEQLDNVRPQFTTTRNFGPGTTLTSVTAPAAPFTTPMLGPGDSVTMYGTLIFQVNNDDGPALIEFPTVENFPELAGMPELQFEPGMTFNGGEVPEPSGAVVAGAVGAAGLLTGRRRRRIG